MRFGLRNQLRFQMVGHGQRELLLPNELGVVKGDIIHFNFSKGISEWVKKHAQYARDEAKTARGDSSKVHLTDWFSARDLVERRRVLKRFSNSMPLRPLMRFIYIYIIRMGFLDGWGGFRYAILIGFYQWLIDLNKIEFDKQGR